MYYVADVDRIRGISHFYMYVRNRGRILKIKIFCVHKLIEKRRIYVVFFFLVSKSTYHKKNANYSNHRTIFTSRVYLKSQFFGDTKMYFIFYVFNLK